MSAGAKLNERKRQRLTDFLQSLPASHARALAECAEEAARSGDAGLPHGLILEALRPVLGEENKLIGQGLAPAQLFALPFEDLVAARRPAESAGHIAQATVDGVWAWLLDVTAGEGGLVREILHGVPDDGGIPRADALAFYRACAETIRGALADAARQESLGARLGGPVALPDVRTMTAILEIAGDALDIRDRFARPHGILTSTDLETLVTMFDDFAGRHPDRAAPFFLVLAGRLEKPWDVLRVMDHVGRRVHSGRKDAADRDAVLDFLFSSLEQSAEFFRRLNKTTFDPAEVARELKGFTWLTDGLSGAVPSEGRWARRLMTCRSVVAEKMEILMERVPRDILAALPVHKIGRFGRVRRRPDIGAPPVPVRSEQAVRMARLLECSRPHAAEAAFKAALSEAAADAREGLGEYAAALLEEMKRMDVDALAPARVWLDLVITLTAYAVGPDEAARLRQRAAALDIAELPGAAAS